jgi:hypothetical protein
LSGIGLWILLCSVAFVWLVILLRRDRFSLGLPIAYLAGLLLIHVPGAATPLLNDQFGFNAEIIEIGIRFAAIGALSFVVGVWLARFSIGKNRPLYQYIERREFWFFCLICGLFVEYGLSFLDSLPSVRSALDKGSAVWMLGALLGLRYAASRGDLRNMVTWGTAALISPILILLLAGFLSYGAAALIAVGSALLISVRSRLKLIFVIVVGAYLGLTVFVNYFIHRTDFRDVAWSGASFGARLDAAAGIFSNFSWFDPTNAEQLSALYDRLNQNYFVGLAALRIQQDQISYLYGRTIWEGVEALVPRVLWPDKPVYGGSGHIVADMTGLRLDEGTSWGVGNVMEFQINFGMPGVVIGFLVLGFLLGWLDLKAALADSRGELGNLMVYFLPGLALIQPNGSIVEVSGGAAAAAVAAYLWRWVWYLWLQRTRDRAPRREFAALR